jgi:lysophospholipase L1-like esterase
MKRYLLATAFAVAMGATTLGLSAAGLGGGVQGPPPAGVQGQPPAGLGGRGAGGGGQRGAPAGPPAPVPPEVAVQRPAPDELTRINAALKNFVNTDTSPDSPLLKKYADLIAVPAPRPNSAIAPVQTAVRTAARHDAFVETAKTGDFDVLFHGDSITDWWQQAAPNGGADVQKKYFGDVKIANFAIAGDTTQGVLWGLQNGEGQGRKPKAVMLMIGTNNTGQNTGPEIAEGIGAVVLELRKDFPDAKILLLAIFPRGAGPTDANRMKNDEANRIIARLHDGKNVFFKSINDKFLDAEGRLIGFRPDNLHPNAQGYEIWAEAVGDTLKNWIK